MTAPHPKAPAFDSWAAYYDVTDADRAPFAAFYRSLVRPTTRSLLELGCGTGTIVQAVGQDIAARHGSAARIVGVDESPEMLRVARSRSGIADWLVGDIRQPPVEGRFDLILSCFNTLQFLLTEDDLARTFAAARELLAPGGTFAFDIYQPNVPYIRVPQTDRLARAVTDEHGRSLEIREDTAYDAGSRILTIDWRLVTPDAPAAPLASARYLMRQHFADDVVRLLESQDLELRARYGDFDRRPFSDRSKRQVVVCGRS